MDADPKIPEHEWQQIVDLLYDIEDAITDDDLNAHSEFLFDLHCLLDKLEQQYGALAMLSAIRADCCQDADEQIQLYEKTLSLAEQQNDPIALIQSLESLCECYAEKGNHDKAESFYKQLMLAVSRYGDEFLCSTLEELESMINSQ